MPARDEELLRRATEAWALAERDLRAERETRRSAERQVAAVGRTATGGRRRLARFVAGNAWQAGARVLQRLGGRPWRSRSYGAYVDPSQVASGAARAELEQLLDARRRAESDWRRERAARARADWRLRALEGGATVVPRAIGKAAAALAPRGRDRRVRAFGPFGPARGAVPVIVVGAAPIALVTAARLAAAGRPVVAVPLSRRGSFAAAVAAGLRAAPHELAVVWAPRAAARLPAVEPLLRRLAADERLGAVALARDSTPIVFDWRHARPLPVVPGGPSTPVALSARLLALRQIATTPAAHSGVGGWEQWSLEHTLASTLAGRRLERLGSSTSPVHPPRIDAEALCAVHGPALRRRVLADLLAGGGDWCARALRLSSTQPHPAGLSAACHDRGWRLVAAGADVALAQTGADGPLRVDWLGNGRGDGAHVPCEGPASDVVAALEASLATPSIAVRVAGSAEGGDYLLARALARALARRGHQCMVELVAVPDPSAAALDVALLVRGRRAAPPRPGQLNLAWLISHPDDVGTGELERFDAVLVASRPYASRLARTLDVPVTTVLQFADAETFRPDPSTEDAHPLAFVGNWRGVLRESAWTALRSGRATALYGAGWELVAPEHVVAEHLPPQRLRRVYSSCDVLLNDHWEDMRRHGFIANRVFDALACGAFVLSDELPALERELPGLVETYRDRDELVRKLDHWLADERAAERRARGAAARTAVLGAHTADHRAAEIATAVAAAISRAAPP